MNKKRANEEAFNNTRSYGDLLELVVSADKSGTSSVNKSITKMQVAQIMIEWLSTLPKDSIPGGQYYDPFKDKIRLSRDGMAIANILREFA
jgi:hypothetical protein